MYRQIFKKSFFYSFQSNQTRYFTTYLDSSRAEKKKKKKKKKNQSESWMHRQRIRGCGKAKYLMSQTNLVPMAFPLPGGGAPHLGAKKQFSACVFNFVHFSFSRLPQNNNVKSPRKWQIYRRSPPGCLPCQNKPFFPKSANQPNEMVLTICNCSRLMRLETRKFSKW